MIMNQTGIHHTHGALYGKQDTASSDKLRDSSWSQIMSLWAEENPEEKSVLKTILFKLLM